MKSTRWFDSVRVETDCYYTQKLSGGMDAVEHIVYTW